MIQQLFAIAMTVTGCVLSRFMCRNHCRSCRKFRIFSRIQISIATKHSSSCIVILLRSECSRTNQQQAQKKPASMQDNYEWGSASACTWAENAINPANLVNCIMALFLGCYRNAQSFWYFYKTISVTLYHKKSKSSQLKSTNDGARLILVTVVSPSSSPLLTNRRSPKTPFNDINKICACDLLLNHTNSSPLHSGLLLLVKGVDSGGPIPCTPPAP
jgi:hypothetical protein